MHPCMHVCMCVLVCEGVWVCLSVCLSVLMYAHKNGCVAYWLKDLIVDLEFTGSSLISYHW